MIDIVEKKDCPYCGSDNVVYNLRGQLICRDCGLIFEPLAPLSPAKKKNVVKKKQVKKKAVKKKATKKKKDC